MRCAACGALNAHGARACGACGATPAPPAARPKTAVTAAPVAEAPEHEESVLASLPPRLAAVFQLGVAAWLFREGYAGIVDARDEVLGAVGVVVMLVVYVVPAIALAVPAAGTLMMRAWGAYASASYCLLVGVAGLVLAAQGHAALGMRLLLASVLVGVLLMLPTSRAAYR